MSKLAVFTSLFALIVTTGVCPSWSVAQSLWQQPTTRNKASVEIGAKIFDRPGDDSVTPVISDSLTNTTLLNQEQATDFGSDFGVEVKINLPGRFDQGLEIRSIITTWDQERTIFGNNLASPFFPDPQNPAIPFVAPQAVTFDIESEFYSFELMRKRVVRPGLTLSLGPRFISTTDEINITANTNTTDAATGTPVTATQFNDFEAKNSLVGLQVGVEINRPVAQSLYFTAFGRAGGYYNATRFDTDTSIVDTLGAITTPDVVTRQTRSTESFVAEAGGRLNFEIIPNSFSTFVGYEATVIDGIALSSANVANFVPIDTNNTVFFHAITFGAKLSY